MDGLLDAQRESLGELQDACLQRPQVHSHQLAALQREVSLCAAACSLADYRQASGDAFELGRAAWLDRIAGRMAVAESVGDGLAVQAEQIEYRSTLRATGHRDWVQTLLDGASESARWHTGSSLAGTGFSRCVLNLLAANSSNPQQQEYSDAARAAWHSFCEVDPVGAAAAIDSPRQLARTRLRLPWCDEALIPVSRWLAKLAPPGAVTERSASEADDSVDNWLRSERSSWQRSWGNPGAAGSGLPLDGDLGADGALSAYRALAESAATAPAVACVARRALELCAGADSSIEVQRRLLAARLPGALAAAGSFAHIDSITVRQLTWSEPLLARHAADLRHSLADVQTVTEVELLTAHASTCLGIEADWQNLLMSSLLAPLRAAAMVGIFGDVEKPTLHLAIGLTHQLLGQGPRALLRSSSLLRLLSGRLLPALDEPDDDRATWHAEAGRELLAPLRGWRATVAGTGDAWAEAHQLAQACARLFDKIGAPEPDVVPMQLHFWEQRAPALDWDRLIGTASRPSIPGWHCGLDSGQAL